MDVMWLKFPFLQSESRQSASVNSALQENCENSKVFRNMSKVRYFYGGHRGGGTGGRSDCFQKFSEISRLIFKYNKSTKAHPCLCFSSQQKRIHGCAFVALLLLANPPLSPSRVVSLFQVETACNCCPSSHLDELAHPSTVHAQPTAYWWQMEQSHAPSTRASHKVPLQNIIFFVLTQKKKRLYRNNLFSLSRGASVGCVWMCRLQATTQDALTTRGRWQQGRAHMCVQVHGQCSIKNNEEGNKSLKTREYRT